MVVILQSVNHQQAIAEFNNYWAHSLNALTVNKTFFGFYHSTIFNLYSSHSRSKQIRPQVLSRNCQLRLRELTIFSYVHIILAILSIIRDEIQHISNQLTYTALPTGPMTAEFRRRLPCTFYMFVLCGLYWLGQHFVIARLSWKARTTIPYRWWEFRLIRPSWRLLGQLRNDRLGNIQNCCKYIRSFDISQTQWRQITVRVRNGHVISNYLRRVVTL